jgi:hypothetical protein
MLRVRFRGSGREDIAAVDLFGGWRSRYGLGLGRRQVEAAVGTMAVVVPDVAVEDAKEVAAAGDQEMVQALPAHGANPTLGDGVGVRRLDRGADDLGADRAPDVIEGPGDLVVAVADQEPGGCGVVVEGGGQVAGLLGDLCAGGVGSDASQVHASGVQLDEEQHVQPVQEYGVHGEEVAGQDAGCLLV